MKTTAAGWLDRLWLSQDVHSVVFGLALVTLAAAESAIVWTATRGAARPLEATGTSARWSLLQETVWAILPALLLLLAVLTAQAIASTH